jgi:hypothetical protein
MQTAGGLALALGLGAGCGHAGVPAAGDPAGAREPVDGARAPAPADDSVEQSLDRLRALQIVEVRGLVLRLPGEATQCYNRPCPGTKWVKVYEDERARQGARLGRLVEVAERVARDAGLAPRPASEAAAAARAVADLAVVQVGGLVEAKPRNNPQCYNLPCASDRAEAERENGLRVARAFAIAGEAARSGL